MAKDRIWLLTAAALMMFLAGSGAFASFISDDVFESHGSMGRSLLQAKKSCTINFEFMNYTIITSRCKGPQYATSLCCAAFKDFACPYSETINDGNNDCANTMFSYINLYGKYPPGLFASECKEGTEGLTCPDNDNSSSPTQMNKSLFSFIIGMSGFVIAFLMY